MNIAWSKKLYWEISSLEIYFRRENNWFKFLFSDSKLLNVLSIEWQIWHTSSLYYNEEVHEYASNLAQRFPQPLNNIFFCNSGSEANDIAILMARLYTGAHDIIALRNAYHGMSISTQSLCGIHSWKFITPTYFNVHHTTNPDPYRGRFGGSNCRDSIIQTTRECDCEAGQCKACDFYIEDLEQLFDTTLPKKIAAFFAESIQGVGGVVQYPKNYLKRASDLG